jgi:hypothetical protein
MSTQKFSTPRTARAAATDRSWSLGEDRAALLRRAHLGHVLIDNERHALAVVGEYHRAA